MITSTGKLIGTLAAIFCAGGVTGAVIGWNSARKSLSKPPTVEKVCNKMRDTLQTRLDLTPGQMARIQPILDETARDLHQVHHRTMDEVQCLFNRCDAQIAKELTQEQQKKFEILNKERQEFWRNRYKKTTNDAKARLK
jgi:hypothetical protein